MENGWKNDENLKNFSNSSWTAVEMRSFEDEKMPSNYIFFGVDCGEISRRSRASERTRNDEERRRNSKWLSHFSHFDLVLVVFEVFLFNFFFPPFHHRQVESCASDERTKMMMIIHQKAAAARLPLIAFFVCLWMSKESCTSTFEMLTCYWGLWTAARGIFCVTSQVSFSQ